MNSVAAALSPRLVCVNGAHFFAAGNNLPHRTSSRAPDLTPLVLSGRLQLLRQARGLPVQGSRVWHRLRQPHRAGGAQRSGCAAGHCMVVPQVMKPRSYTCIQHGKQCCTYASYIALAKSTTPATGRQVDAAEADDRRSDPLCGHRGPPLAPVHRPLPPALRRPAGRDKDGETVLIVIDDARFFAWLWL